MNQINSRRRKEQKNIEILCDTQFFDGEPRNN